MYKLYNNLKLNFLENQDLYRNKDDFRFFFNKKFLYFDLKYFIFFNNSVKCIVCRMTYNIITISIIIVCTKWIKGSVPLQKYTMY